MRTGLLAVAALVFAPFAAVAADPPIVLQTLPPGRILEEVRTIAKAAGGDQALQNLNEALQKALGEKGLEGIDLGRPVLGYALLDDKLEELTGVLMVPVTGENEFLGFYERAFGKKLEPGKDGLYTIDVGGEDSKAKLMMRFQAQYAYLAVGKKPAPALDKKALVPAATVFDPSEKSLVSLKVHFTRLPKQTRGEISNGLKEIKKQLEAMKLPPEASEPARLAAEEMIKLGDRYADLLQDADTATARVILDSEVGEAGLELGLTGKPGSELAKAIEARKPGTNKFAGLVTPDTVFGLKLQLPFFAPEIQKAAVIGLEAAQKQAGENVPPEFKGAVDEALKGLSRTVKGGEVDLAVALRGPDKKGLYSAVAAVAFDDPAALEKELRGLAEKELPPMFREMLKLDVAKVGKTSIHEAKLGAFLPAEAKKLFGEEASLAFAFAPNGIFLAFGPDAVTTMKGALGVKKGPSPGFEIVVNPKQVSKLAAEFGQPMDDAAEQPDKLISAFAVSLEGGKELRLRLVTNWKSYSRLSKFGLASGGPAKPVQIK